MELSTLGIATAASMGLHLGSKAIDSTVDFAKILSAKMSGSEETAQTDDLADEGNELPQPIQASLDKLDSFLRSMGLDPEVSRSVRHMENGSVQVGVDTASLEAWQRTSLKNWSEDNPKDAQLLQLA